MPDEINPHPIDDPKPVQSGDGFEMLTGITAAVAVSVGSVLALAVLLTPTRLAGASRSAKLRWQQREKEIHQVIETEGSQGTKAPPLDTEYPRRNLSDL